MAWEDYIAVVDSDLYEQAGLAKPILSRIAYLIVGPPEEGQEADPNEGWCFATQDYLAANIGCSESEVQRVCLTFVEDGWLTSRVVRNKNGHPRKHYRWADGALARVKEHKMKKDGHRRFIRVKNTKKANKKSFAASCRQADIEGSSRQVAAEPRGAEPSSFTARKRKPHGKLPEELDLSRSSEQVFEQGKHADKTDASLDHFVETRETLDPKDQPQTLSAFQMFDDDDERSTPVQPSAPQARVIPPPAPRCRACKSVLKGGKEIATGRCEACQEKARKEQEKLDAHRAELRRVMGTHTWDRRYTCMNCQVHQDDIHYGTAGECPGAQVKSAAAGAEDIELPKSKAFELED